MISVLLFLTALPIAAAGQGPVHVDILDPGGDLLFEDWEGVSFPLYAQVQAPGASSFQGWVCTWRLDLAVLGEEPVAEDGTCAGWLDLSGAEVGVHRLSVTAAPPASSSGPVPGGFAALFIRLVNGMAASGDVEFLLEGEGDCPATSASGRGLCWDLLIEDGVLTSRSGLPERTPGTEGGDPYSYELILEFGELKGGDVSLGAWSGNLDATATAWASGQEKVVLPVQETSGHETCSADWRLEAVVGDGTEAPETFTLRSATRLVFMESTTASFAESMSGTGAGPFVWSAGDGAYPSFSFEVTLADPVLSSGSIQADWASESGWFVDGCDPTSTPGTYRCSFATADLTPGVYTLGFRDTDACLTIGEELDITLYEPEVVDNDFDGATEAGVDYSGAAVPTDCDDESASTFEGGVELCNTVDDDCDGAVNGGLEYEGDVGDADNDLELDATLQLDDAGAELTTTNDGTTEGEEPDLWVQGNLVHADDVDWYRFRLQEESDDDRSTVSFDLSLVVPCEDVLSLESWAVDIARSRVVYGIESLPYGEDTLLLSTASASTTCDAKGEGRITWEVEGSPDPFTEGEEIWWVGVRPAGAWDTNMCGTDPTDPTPTPTYIVELRD